MGSSERRQGFRPAVLLSCKSRSSCLKKLRLNMLATPGAAGQQIVPMIEPRILSRRPIIRSVEELEQGLSDPTPAVVETMRRLEGDLLVLGVGGKMGPSLARMAKRASEAAGIQRRIIGVARFSAPGLAAELERDGIETVSCDLLDDAALLKLPEASNILYLAGMKFGATGNEPLTWAMNTYLPAAVCRRFPKSRIVAFSTGNVYGLVPAESGGSRETDTPQPVGEYAMSCLGRERMFEYFSRTRGTPVALIRLNYACDLRYGVLVDIAQKVIAGAPVELGINCFNTIWQGDANALTLQCFDHVASPPFFLNVTGPEIIRVREAATQLGKLLGREPKFSGREKETALLSNASKSFDLFGQPGMTGEELLEQVAAWVSSGGPTLNKPTHFESRDGKF
jgi:nucleoside-diphosphate-sugar epimerase